MAVIKLNLQYFAGEKTEKATSKKREEVRKKGQVVKSSDVNTAISLLAIFLFFLSSGKLLSSKFMAIFYETFQHYLLNQITIEQVQSIYIKVIIEISGALGPILLVALLAGVGANYMQVGFLFSTEAIQMQLSKIDPIQGFKRIYSLRAIVELIKSILKIVFVGVVTFSVIWFKLDELLTLSQKTLGASLVFFAKLTVDMGLYASAALLFLSLLDYFYQKFDYEKNIRMSKQDIKDEYKKSEGDPLIKSKIKQKQREMAMQRMMQEVPKADVIITNPTHYAIALKYDEKKMDAPYVIAKGIDFVAQKIKEKAKEFDIVTIENRPLARALYAQTEIGDAIPDEFFKAVAEILAYIYRLKGNV
jgi:flagellar biosynthetic protein FlhB